ncbi:unnamed protein product [Larinioides sclopetarius]|uniref:Reverse transcriptase domain-containing protein n=1 Tax=Larinioides sclopetarius TaxID=280406 RepID=A0AAV2AQY7_9ARAC
MATEIPSLTVLNRKRSSLKGQITRLTNLLNSGNLTEPSEVQVKMISVQKLKVKLDELRNEGFEKIQDENLDDFESTIIEMEETIDTIEVSLLKLITLNSNTETNVSDEVTDAKIKLPSISLPKFSGQYVEWLSFKSQFVTLIDKNKQLSDSQKLYYLQSSLTGNAKQLQTLDDSYASLFEALQKRYENKRLIVNGHVNELLNIHKLKIESAKELRNMIDNVLSHLRALKQLGLELNELSEAILRNVILQRIDDDSRRVFEMSLTSNELPKWDAFIEFLSKRSQALENVQRCVPNTKPKLEYSFKKQSFVLQNDKCVCTFCKQNHLIFKCQKCLGLSVNERLNEVRKLQLCFNCLNKHKVSVCNKLNYKCKSCSRNHHTYLHGADFLIHGNNNNNKNTVSETSSRNLESSSMPANPSTNAQSSDMSLIVSTQSCYFSESKVPPLVLLSTAVIHVRGADGRDHSFNAILDSGSEISCLTKEAADLLGLRKHSISSLITGLNGAALNVKHKINACISNKNWEFQRSLNMLVVPKITDVTPSKFIDVSKLNLPKNITYANPKFFEPQRVHVLLGGDIFYEILQTEKMKLKDSNLILQNSVFGWIVAGTLHVEGNKSNFQCNLAIDQSEVYLRKFWELESIGIKYEPKCSEEDNALDIFKETVRFKDDRYEVSLPWKKDWKELNDNFNIAKRRFSYLFKKFQSDKELYTQYRDILRDYLDKQIIEKVPNPTEPVDKPVFYLPHHAVFRKESVYTKCRIVFDASSNEVGELSLNDCLWSGTNLNQNIFNLLIFFRLNKIAVLSDIEKAFLQISLSEKDRDALRFIFTSENLTDCDIYPIEVYRFKRLPFGITSSPFLLAATIKKHLENYRDRFPNATQLLDNCMYVDDFISGADSVNAAFNVSLDADKIMKDANMHLRKWISNDSTLMKLWEEEGFSTLPRKTLDSPDPELHKVLGLSWDIQQDGLTMDIKDLLIFLERGENTKRFVLQAAGRIFDPLGLVSPFTVRLKCLFQELWQRKISWDGELPPDLQKTWLQWCTELPQLTSLSSDEYQIKTWVPKKIFSCEVRVFVIKDG